MIQSARPRLDQLLTATREEHYPLASPILDGLNPQQTAAVTAPGGPVLVLAGPGSGKTRVLSHRIAWLVKEQGVPPWRIMAMTFTNKAAREMRSRVERLLDGSLQGISLGTFHGICARILRREAGHYLPFSRDFVIFDTSDQTALIRDIIAQDMSLDEKRYQPQKVLGRISQAKNDLITPDTYRPRDYFDEIVRRAYQIYQERLAANNAVDFDDLLMHVALMFGEHQDVLARYQHDYDHVLVDEFQDTNGAQYVLLKQLTALRRNLFCVGDEDQSIYRWRGADYRNLLRLREDFPELHTVLLEQNYRSTQLILNAARAVIDKNTQRTPKNLFTRVEGGPRIAYYEAHNEQYEAQFVVDAIATLTALGEVQPGGCAVMYRTNAQSRVIEEAFVRANLPYRLVGATRFYGRREIKDVIAYLRVIHNPDDSISLLRIINTPPRSIGDKTIEVLQTWAASQHLSPGAALLHLAQEPDSGPFSGRSRNALAAFGQMLTGWRSVAGSLSISDLLKMVLSETKYLETLDDGTEQSEERAGNVVELLNLAAEYETLPLSTFLEEVALVSDVDNLDEVANAPSLLTLHAAKGLEFDAVFIVGLEEGILPHERARDDPEEMAEERRLMYVGMTRARQYLFLVYAFRRTVWGESALNLRSRFVDDIPDDLLAPASAGASFGYARPARVSSGPPRLDGGQGMARGSAEFREGQRVAHPRFGEGLIVGCRPSGSDLEVSVVFDEGGLKRLLVSFANLTVLEK
jgi:DNA helicase-2/ATP-dependent DNA helicase PcrA